MTWALFRNAFRNIYDAQFITQDDMDVIAGHVAGLGAFNEVEVDCNVVRPFWRFCGVLPTSVDRGVGFNSVGSRA